jgi:hypothetical protein
MVERSGSKSRRAVRASIIPGVLKFCKMESSCFSLGHPLRHGLVVVKAKPAREL